jgi:hypothetical protein
LRQRGKVDHDHLVIRGTKDKLPPLESQSRDLRLKGQMAPDFDRMPNGIRGRLTID